MDPATREHLEELRAQYQVTQNPCFAWYALALIVQQPAPTVLPDWLVVYFRGASQEVMGAVMTMKADDVPRFLGAALGITRGSKNLVPEWRELTGAGILLGRYELMKVQHAARRASAKKAGRRRPEMSPSEFAEEKLAVFWRVTGGQARRKIAGLRKYLTEVAQAQGKNLDLDALRDQAAGYTSFEGQLAEMIESGEATHIPEQSAKVRRKELAFARAIAPAKSRTRIMKR
jgi:hypothetical protein